MFLNSGKEVYSKNACVPCFSLSEWTSLVFTTYILTAYDWSEYCNNVTSGELINTSFV